MPAGKHKRVQKGRQNTVFLSGYISSFHDTDHYKSGAFWVCRVTQNLRTWSDLILFYKHFIDILKNKCIMSIRICMKIQVFSKVYKTV